MESPNLFAENVWNFPISLFPDNEIYTMKHQPSAVINRSSGVGHFFPLQSISCSRHWS